MECKQQHIGTRLQAVRTAHPPQFTHISVLCELPAAGQSLGGTCTIYSPATAAAQQEAHLLGSQLLQTCTLTHAHTHTQELPVSSTWVMAKNSHLPCQLHSTEGKFRPQMLAALQRGNGSQNDILAVKMHQASRCASQGIQKQWIPTFYSPVKISVSFPCNVQQLSLILTDLNLDQSVTLSTEE